MRIYVKELAETQLEASLILVQNKFRIYKQNLGTKIKSFFSFFFHKLLEIPLYDVLECDKSHRSNRDEKGNLKELRREEKHGSKEGPC